MASFGDLFFRFADGCDMFLFWNGIFWSFLFGAALPAFCIIFGELLDDMGEMSAAPNEEAANPMSQNSLYMVYNALGVMVTTSLYIGALGIYSESIAHKLKIVYFTKALTKDAAFYDE